MKLTLTKRWVEYKSLDETKIIKSGLEIQYSINAFERPSLGIIKKKKGQFVIEWEDINNDTPLDDSNNSNEILKSCQFL